MISLFPGSLLILVGVFFLALRSPLSSLAVVELRKAFPKLQTSEAAYGVALAVVGVVFVIMGILSVFNLIRFK